MTESLKKVMTDVEAERSRQDKKWGVQDHHPIEWTVILGEEYGEAAKAAWEAHADDYPTTGDYSNYREELIQVAAVAIAAVENLDKGLQHG